MENYFPYEIIAHIISYADVTIDTRLAYGVKPKKLNIDKQTTTLLNSLCNRRLSFYAIYKNNIEIMKNSEGLIKYTCPLLERVESEHENVRIWLDFIDINGELCYWFMKYSPSYYRSWGAYSVHDGATVNF